MMGLAGMGDLILTCTGALSRNRQVGLKLAEGKSLDVILAELGHVAEGVSTAREVLTMAERLEVEMPITAAVCGLLYQGNEPHRVVEGLLSRAPKSEVVACLNVLPSGKKPPWRLFHAASCC
jgi:glycerol-3-phosphate dehydrogenase (NAD(P)+)